MLQPELREEIIRREGDSASRVSPGAEDTRDPSEARDALWQTWLTVTAELQDFGFSPNTLCEGINSVAEVRHEFAEAREQVT